MATLKAYFEKKKKSTSAVRQKTSHSRDEIARVVGESIRAKNAETSIDEWCSGGSLDMQKASATGHTSPIVQEHVFPNTDTIKMVEKHEAATGGHVQPSVDSNHPRDVEVRDEDERKRVLRSFGETPVIQLNAHCYTEVPLFPAHLKKLSRLFAVLRSICKFNAAKDMATIYHKSRKCIENLLSKRVALVDFEQLNWLLPELFRFKKIKVHHFGEEIVSFTIEMDAGAPSLVDARIMDLIASERGNNRRGDDIVVSRRPLFDDSPNNELIATQDMEEKDVPKEKYEVAEVEGKAKALSILDRIRERERARKQSFVDRSREKDELEEIKEKILSYFMVEKRKSEEVTKLIRILGLYNGRECIKMLCSNHVCFSLKDFDGETLLVLSDDRHACTEPK